MFSDNIGWIWLVVVASVSLLALSVVILKRAWNNGCERRAVLSSVSGVLALVVAICSTASLANAYIDRGNCDKKVEYVKFAGYKAKRWWTITGGCHIFVKINGVVVPYDTWVNDRILPGDLPDIPDEPSIPPPPPSPAQPPTPTPTPTPAAIGGLG